MQSWTLQPEQVKQIKCLKNQDVNPISISAENTGAFVSIIPVSQKLVISFTIYIMNLIINILLFLHFCHLYHFYNLEN